MKTTISKITQSWSEMKRGHKGIAAGFIVVGLLAMFGVSVNITNSRTSPEGVYVTLPTTKPFEQAMEAAINGEKFVPLAQDRYRVEINGVQKAEAAENAWGFVRQSATWANANSMLADNLITSLKTQGLLSGTNNWSLTNVNMNGTLYKIKLQTNLGSPVSASSTAYSGTKDFSNRFKMWRQSDNTQVLELLFDDVSSPGTGDGILMNYALALLDSTSANNSALVVESYISGTSPSRKQTYSWGQQFWTSGSNAATSSDKGRVVLEEMTLQIQNGSPTTGLCVTIAARTVSQTITGCNGGAAAPFYYALAYGQETVGSMRALAKAGLNTNLTTGGLFCGVLNLNYGRFNSGGFVGDSVATGTTLDGFPSKGDGTSYGVDFIFTRVGGTNSNDYKDLSQTKIDGLSTQFRSANDPP